MTTKYWEPYSPTPDEPWDLRRVVHLHKRAGFASTWGEIQRDLADGPEASVTRLLAGKPRAVGVPPDFEQTAGLLAEAAVASRDISRLKAWWIYRMLFSPDPLAERLTLMWHNHFATSNLKVDDPVAMRRQNDVFREFGHAPFGELLRRVVRDPAVLIWLDAPANRKEHPNENLARELMELFSIGVGHYSETDVKEAARALTGWTVTSKGEFSEAAGRHDGGEKTIFGKNGPWSGDELVQMLLDHPATSTRLAFRVCEMFMAEETAVSGVAEAPAQRSPGERESALPRAAVESLADGLRVRNLDIGWAVETVLRSRLFFSDRNIAGRVPGPAEFVVGSARALELFDPAPSTLLLAEWVTRLGQDLFYPPNVFGWPGGRSWVTTRSINVRVKFAAALVGGALRNPAVPFDALALAMRQGRGDDLTTAIAFYCELLLGNAKGAVVDEIQAAMLRPAANETLEEQVRHAVATILSRPEAELG